MGIDRAKKTFVIGGSREALRTAGGVLFGVGALALYLRKASGPDFFSERDWGDLALLITLLIPCLLLNLAALIGWRARRELRPWQAVYLIFGLILVPLALFQLLAWIDADTGAALNVFWVFLLTAALGGVWGLAVGVRYTLLLGSIALIISWTALWNELIGLPDEAGAYRALLLVVAGLLLGAAVGVYLMDRSRGAVRPSELVTGAGIAVVLATEGVPILAAGVFEVPFVNGPIEWTQSSAAQPSSVWHLVLLVSAVLLIVHGSRIGVRGPGYVGALGLLFFVFLVGWDIGNDPPENKLAGWPLAALIAGVVASLLSLIPSRARGERSSARKP